MRHLTRISEPWLRAISVLTFIVIWQVGADIAHSDVLPGPLAVAVGIYQHLAHGELAYHVAITLARVAVSFVIAMAIGTAVGILMGRRSTANALLDEMLILGLNVPALVGESKTLAPGTFWSKYRY